MKKRILIFTDSRGQHIPADSTHKIFPERIRDEGKDVHVDLVLCPMKWTTTMDFYEYCQKNDISSYDWIVLFTGIVEWSPRPQQSAISDLYNNQNEENTDAWKLNTRDYSKKIVNNKKATFDKLFGAKEIKKYLSKAFDVLYEDSQTINMLSKDMARNVVGPWLSKFDNLIYINANRILPDWEGDFKRERPKNINVTHEYCDIISEFIPSHRLVDLRKWNSEDIKEYTCDNMHLTQKGNEYIVEELQEKLNIELKSEWEIIKTTFEDQIEHDIGELIKMKNLESFRGQKKESFIQNYTDSKYLATLIIGVRIKEDDPLRMDNLHFLLKWLHHFYEDMFDILIVEQDDSPKLNIKSFSEYSNIRYEFVYNPEDYNRGWGYNVAVKHFCKEAKVVVLMDTDVLTGANFIADVRDCYIGKYKVVSPYQNIYYTDYEEVQSLKESYKFNVLTNEAKIKNPVTITGGIVIFDKNTYLELKGFEQYIGYSSEDRGLDVMVLSMCKKEDIKISNVAYVHLFHETDKSARKNFNEIYGHLKENYKCEWTSELKKTDFIHKYCNHADKSNLVTLLIEKDKNFGDINLYKNRQRLSPNGRIIEDNKEENSSVILPPDFKGLSSYKERELYQAPDADINELEKFRNAFLGKRCFIIGNGPSLNKHDLSLLENEYTFGVNSFYYKTKETGFRPTFYVVEDTSVMKENLSEIKKFYAPFKFFPTIYKRLHPKTPNTFFFTMNRGFYEKSSPNYCVPRFSTDATKELFCGQSVTYINLQLAYFMGFTEIYLIGMDFSYIIPNSHKRTGDVLLSDSDDENHFHKDYFGKGKTWKDPKLDRVGMNYRQAKLVFEATNRKIYNATVGGSLEIFDRVDYYSLFDIVKQDKVSNEVVTENFKDANKLFSKGQYADALIVYLHLAEKNPDFSIYKQASLTAFVKAKETKQPIQEEVKKRILSFL